MNKNINIVAEIGCSHGGDLNRAKYLIQLASIYGANYAKFQKRNPKESIPKDLVNKPHPNPKFSYGKTYLEHREFLEFNISQHIELYNHCLANNIKYSTSVWDITSAKDIINNLDLDYIKIPSARNNDYKLIEFLIDNFKNKIHISLGMMPRSEQHKLFNLFKKDINKFVFYHCVSEYPCSFEHTFLLEIVKLKEQFDIVGFSDHSIGYLNSIAAYMLGASWIEKHFIDETSFKHTDAALSLTPKELKQLNTDINNLQKSLKFKDVEITDGEQEQIIKLKKP